MQEVENVGFDRVERTDCIPQSAALRGLQQRRSDGRRHDNRNEAIAIRVLRASA
jgi:hypothetical protein